MRENNPINIKGVSVDWWQKRSQFVSDKLNEIPDGVKIINPEKLFCDSQHCYVVQNCTSLYFDDDHLSVEGAKIVANEILSYMNQ